MCNQGYALRKRQHRGCDAYAWTFAGRQRRNGEIVWKKIKANWTALLTISMHISCLLSTITELDASYRTAEKAYAKGILNRLHTAMVEQYGDTRFVCGHGDMQGLCCDSRRGTGERKPEEIALALLGIDLSSSGEHCQTEFLCKYGVVSQGHNDFAEALAGEITARYLPYDYCYTADIAGDIHISKSRLPEGIREMLKTFQDHTAELLFEENKDMDMER